jgi:hypothetical protein
MHPNRTLVGPRPSPNRFPGQDRRRGRRIPAGRAAPLAQGPHCKVPGSSKGLDANRGYGCDALDLSRVQFAKCFFTIWCVSAAPCKIRIKSQKNPKIANSILLYSMWLDLRLFQSMYILMSFNFCLKNWNVKSLHLCFCKIHTWSWAGFWICCGN